MKKIYIRLVLVGIIGASILYVVRFNYTAEKKETDSPYTTIAQNAEKTQTIYSPYTIESLKTRSYNTTITRESVAYQTGKFSAYIASYMSDGLKLYTLLSIPKTKKPNTGFPVLIMNHGYIDPNEYSTIQSYKRTFDEYASQGFIVLKPDYRANGKSEGDKKNPLNRLSYPIDVLYLVHAIHSITEADSKKIYMWGHSMGGDITLKVLESTDKVRKATLWAPVSADYPESMLYFIRKNRPDELEKVEKLIEKIIPATELKKLSPYQYVSYITAPLLIHHGTNDESVPYSWSTTLSSQLTAKKIPHTFYTYDDDHNFTHGSRATVIERDLQFFSGL